MGDANPIRTLRFYSKPSHEGYRNTIELLKGNNVDPSPYGRILLLVSLLNSFHREGLQNSIMTSLFQIFYNRINEALKKSIDYAAEGRLRKLSAEKAWAAIKKLAQYDDEGWSDPIIPEEGNLDYENLDIEHLLGVMEYKVDALMKNAISLMGRSECVFRITSNEMYQLPPEPSHQKEFDHIVTNFILDQEERVKQLEEYMEVIMGDFMQLSSEEGDLIDKIGKFEDLLIDGQAILVDEACNLLKKSRVF
ncbi:hypothetical protein Tco_1013075, partial [Tanacetum coccineum]